MNTEAITWTLASDGPPDADTTVLIELDPATDYSEPVFMGYWDGICWRDVHSVPVQVVAWGDMPKGTRG